MNPDGYFEVTWTKVVNLMGEHGDVEYLERHTLVRSDVNLGLENVLAIFRDHHPDAEAVLRVEVSQVDEVLP